MKYKFLYSIALCMGLAFTACNDDDEYFINTNPMLDESSVVTGSADVTANSATLHATVKGLENCSPQSYAVGFNYGYDQNNLNESVVGSLNEEVVSAELTGLTNGVTLYYQAFAKLQGRLVYTGEVKSLVTTDAKVLAKDATEVDFASGKIGATITDAPADAACGVVISTSSNPEDVRAGLVIPMDALSADYVLPVEGLLPAKTYYYTGYLDLGAGTVYGDVKSFTTAPYDFDLDNDLVDLGLSVKWGRFNVGAKKASDLGGLFGFGDVNGVNPGIDPAGFASADTYRTAADIANVAYNGSVTLPTANDFEELFAKCRVEWTTEDGVNGYKFTGPNGNSIFLPAAGSRTMSATTGEGVKGVYLTGTVNKANTQYAVAYQFASGSNGRVTTPVYEALSARPVSTARNVAFNKELLYNTWEIDYNPETLASIRFAGPVHFYGTDDSWRTVTNNEPVVGNSWAWEAGAENTWAFGNCAGYMTLTPEGKIVVKLQDGEELEGTYTVDEANKTITSTIDLLHPSAMSGYADYKTAIKVLQLTDEKFSLGFFRDSDPATVSVNMIPQSKKYGIPFSLCIIASDWSTGDWGAEVATIIPDEIEGAHTLTFEGAVPEAMIFNLDVKGLKEKYPNALVTVTGMRVDGEKLPFDAAKFRYGDIENNGNFRVEFFNIFGKNSNGGAVVESPFSSLTNAGVEPAVNFTSKLEIDVYVTLDNTFTPNLITINPSWAGTWGTPGDSFTVDINSDAKYTLSKNAMSITYVPDGVDHSAGSIMTFIEIKPLHGLFPGAKGTLTGLKLDGNAVTGWDPAKVLNTNDGTGYRLELWNTYGATGQYGAKECAFGPFDGDNVAALGFSTSMQVDFTLDSLY